MSKKYPIKNYQSNHYRITPRVNPQAIRIPASIIPTNPTGNRNCAGQIKTRIHLKDKNGNEMDIYQNQQVLNLLNSDRGSWRIGNDTNNRHNNYRRKKYVPR